MDEEAKVEVRVEEEKEVEEVASVEEAASAKAVRLGSRLYRPEELKDAALTEDLNIGNGDC